jgi:predicted aspartyl protease
VVDSGATSTCIRPADAAHVQILQEQSPKVFLNANGTTSRAGNKAKLLYDLRVPAIEADMVPNLAMNSLLSTSKMADASYVTVFTKD